MNDRRKKGPPPASPDPINPQPLEGGCNHMIPDERPERTG